MNATVAPLLLIVAAAGIVPWLYGHRHRFIAWCFAITAFLLVAAVPVWREALVSLIATKTGIAVLGFLDVAFGLAFWHEAIHRPKRPAAAGSQLAIAGPQGGKKAPKGKRPPRPHGKHNHRIRTPVVAMVFATCAALTIGAGGKLLSEIGKSPAAATKALSLSSHQISRISNGHAAPMTQQHAGTIVFVAVIILAALIAVGVRAERHRNGGGTGKGGPKALGGGFTAAQKTRRS